MSLPKKRSNGAAALLEDTGVVGTDLPPGNVMAEAEVRMVDQPVVLRMDQVHLLRRLATERSIQRNKRPDMSALVRECIDEAAKRGFFKVAP